MNVFQEDAFKLCCCAVIACGVVAVCYLSYRGYVEVERHIPRTGELWLTSAHGERVVHGTSVWALPVKDDEGRVIYIPYTQFIREFP